MPHRLGWILLLALGLIAAGSARPALADDTYTEWAPRPCEQSAFVPPPGAGNLACRARDLTTDNAQRQGRHSYTTSCLFHENSMRTADENPAAPAVHFWTIVAADPSAGCYAMIYGADQLVTRIKNLDAMTKQAGGWTDPTQIDGATVVQFMSASGRRCVGFGRHGEPNRGGVTSRLIGYYCQPRQGGTALLTNDALGRTLALARLRTG